MTLSTTNVIFRMDGFEAQIWVLLCLAGLLVVVFFDKISVKFAKRNKNGMMESCIKFRKMDFSTKAQSAS